jgi:hypothetical protein
MKSKIWLSLSLLLVLSGIGWAQTAKKTITNFDLEKFKRQREKAEADYRANYKKRGMPSPEEIEKINQENRLQREELSERLRSENQENQNYWQSIADSLRYQIYDINAQINYLNGQLGSLPNQNQIFNSPSQLSSTTIVGYGNNRGYGRERRVPRTVIKPIDNVQTVTNAAAANPNPFYGTPLYPSGTKLVIGQPNRNFGRRGHGKYYGNGAYFVPNIPDNYSFQRDELVSRLQYLGQVKAGLFAQWNNLVTEAHRAGVSLKL